MIELVGVNKFYNSNGITNLGLRNINLKLNKGEIVAIVGDSGSGKSTLLNVICKNDDFDEGEIYYKGNETSYFSIKDMDDFRKNKIGFIFQNYNIIDSYTVLENVMLPLILKGIDSKEAKDKALELIEKVGLKGKEKNRGTKLSGGEKQRCVIARALASDCEILACDEPTGNLDSNTSKEIIKLIKEVSKDKLVLIVTHNYEDFEDICTRKIRISDGEIVEDVTFKEGIETIDEALDLDYVKLPFKTSLKVAKNNILFTPKKSIFLTCVFTLVFALTFFLLQTLIVEIDASYGYGGYRTIQGDRYYAYNYDHSAIDYNTLQSNKSISHISVNPFYEDNSIYLNFENEKYGYYASRGFYISSYIHNVEYYKGDPTKNGAILITSYKDNELENFVGQKQNFNIDDSKIDIEIVAIGYSQYALRDLIIFNDDVLKHISPRYNKFTIENDEGLTKAKTVVFDKYHVDYKNGLTVSGYNIETITKPLVVMPNKYKTQTNKVLLQDLYEVDVDVVYDDIYQPIVYLNDNITFDTYEISLYSENRNKVESACESLNLKCDKVNDIKATQVDLESLILEITSYLSIFGVACILIIIFYVTYFILHKIYQSKKNDYQILRTLGVTRSDMSNIVLLEVGLVGVTCIIVGGILSIVLFLTVKQLYTLLPIKFNTFVFYIIFSLVFTYAVGKRFNKKLFKFTVSKSLKEE